MAALSVGGITSSRCTIEETYLVQKLIRGGFGNNNVDTCARVCHSPTGYGLSQAFGTSAGTQDFDWVEEADVVLIIGCNPTDAHPVVGSQIKKRLREGASSSSSIPAAPNWCARPISRRRIIFRSSPAPMSPSSRRSLTWSSRRLTNETSCASAATGTNIRTGRAFVSEERNSPEAVEKYTGVPAETLRGAARLYATGGNATIITALASPNTAKARRR